MLLINEQVVAKQTETFSAGIKVIDCILLSGLVVNLLVLTT